MSNQINQQDPSQALLASWQQNAAPWSEAVRSQAIESRRLVSDQAIVDAIMLHPPLKFLDLGCGEGWLLRRLTEAGLNGVGIDGSLPLIQLAIQAGHGRFIHLPYAELITEPERAGTGFDTIVANFALLEERLEPLLAALRQIATPHGRLLIQTLHPLLAGEPYRDGWRSEDFAGFGDQDWQPMPWYFRTLSSWIGLLHGSGWRLEALSEPLHPERLQPVSLLLSCVKNP